MRERVINHVENLRNKEQLTQEALAREVGITRQTVIAIERGNYTPSVLLAIKIAKYFKVSVESLFKIQ